MSCYFLLHLCYLVIKAIYKGLRNSYSQNRLINYLLSLCGKCRLYNKSSLKKCSTFPKFSHCEKEMTLHICVKYLYSTASVVIFFFFSQCSHTVLLPLQSEISAVLSEIQVCATSGAFQLSSLLVTDSTSFLASLDVDKGKFTMHSGMLQTVSW